MSVKFITSSTLSSYPDTTYKEVLILGRSNVGKSTFINRLTKEQIARSSSTPGRTRLLNFFLVDESFIIVDAPGYGYTVTGVSNRQTFLQYIETYINTRQQLSLIILLVDSRHRLSALDMTMIEYLNQLQIPYYLIATKGDKLNQKNRQLHKNEIATLPKTYLYYYLTSLPDHVTYKIILNQIKKTLAD